MPLGEGPTHCRETTLTEKSISSVSELLQALAEDVGEYQGSLWFRGQSAFDWTLTPGYYRLGSPPPETTLLKRFRQSAALLLSKDPAASFDWLFLMQHYGIPTRLLDWTESPLIALYFIAHDTPTDSDAALWVLKPSELNKAARINDAAEAFFIPSFEDEELSKYTIEELSGGPRRTQLLPLAVIATRNNARIQAQLGVFTIHHLDTTPIEQVGERSHTIKYRIPRAAIETLRRELTLLGYTKFTIFPELSSIGDNIRSGLS
jgi:hypothetical protein